MRTFKKYCKIWGLESAVGQKHTEESITPLIQTLLLRFPRNGAGSLRTMLLQDYQVRVSKYVVLNVLRRIDPEGVKSRKGKRYKRKVFYAAGVNHLWVFDQHDKWAKYGLYFHMGIEPFSGKILWLVCWWTNSNPRYIAHQYLETARRLGNETHAILPLITQSDPGSENNGIANAHTSIRHHLDPSLAGSLQHRWKRKHNNIKSEIAWSVFRSIWAPGFEDLLELGVDQGWYDVTNSLHYFVFRWIAIPFIQHELDKYVHRNNTTAKRADKHKVLPHGIPDIIFERPHRFDAVDFHINVPHNILDQAQDQWAPRDHPVFQLVHPHFDEFIRPIYESLNLPATDVTNFWTIYLALIAAALAAEENQRVVQLLDAQMKVAEGGEDQGIPLLQGLSPVVMGENGIPMGFTLQNDGHGYQEDDEDLYVIFSDEEDEDEAW
ncbi:hypothetical protein PUNSTDRAFT_61541 [Punctularia strigosozonata HHB-11173 SS5]|uniref:uncharacterized protein n=1 Tax=Punctularia strigosozonata (strain HHB-11173) TaxID=741275 RepID=UPI0004417813|nr:uncharacterized protein PUNSTDRAFT_61541 [Punctularia strigosozonata HHB-11173 SS5]EIN12498.1 hypothetical protein PUNSTDRAFT_61541 [Punctularia strigosozonata HHB-11173 SS5]